MEFQLGIGTRKGLFLARSEDRENWELSEPKFPMEAVRAVALTPGKVYAAAVNEHFGPTIATSEDFGETWSEPDHAPVAFPADTETALEGIW
ncbi:sialidase family protein [Amycolatopsis japonica]